MMSHSTTDATARAAVRKARSELGRAKRKARRLARAGVTRTRMLARRRRWRGVYVLASGEELAALRTSAIDEMRRAVAAGIPVEVLVLEFASDVPPARLPDGVAVYRFWEDAAPGAGAYVPRARTGDAADAPVPRSDGTWLPGRYRDGMPVVAVDTDVSGTRVEHYGPTGRPVRRDELDRHGRLVRVLDLDTSGGDAVTQRYFDTSGECWLTVGVDGGIRGRALRHLPRTAEYPDLAAVQAEWVARRLSTTVSPVVISAGEASGAVEGRVRRTVLARR